MFVCVIRIKIHLYSPQSLKEKRSIIKSLIQKTKHKFSLAIAEVADQDLWQSAVLGIALVGNKKSFLEREMEQILRFLEQGGDLEIVTVNHEIWGYTADLS